MATVTIAFHVPDFDEQPDWFDELDSFDSNTRRALLTVNIPDHGIRQHRDSHGTSHFFQTSIDVDTDTVDHAVDRFFSVFADAAPFDWGKFDVETINAE